MNGKGKPTPKRKEAEAARKLGLTIPKDAKAARKAARARGREQAAERRAGLMRGDARYFPARDAGPVKAYVRNWVDSRRSVGEYFIPFAILILVMSLFPNQRVQLAVVNMWLGLVLLLFADSVFIGWQIRRLVGREFTEPSAKKGVRAYAIMRAMQVRRLRIPPPQVKPGRKA